MPIPVLRRSITPVPTGPTPPQPVYWGRTYVSVTGKNGGGEEIPLTDFRNSLWPGIVLMPGSTGLDAPPFELHSDDSPNLDGGIFRDARAVAREVMLPIFLYGIDRQTIKAMKSKLVSHLNPKKGYCVLKFVEGDGVPRYLRCYYKGGMEGSEAEDQAGFKWVKYGLQFTAYEPYFYSDDVQVAQWEFGDTQAFLDTTKALFPIRLNAGRLANDKVTVFNPGDVEAWPRWELEGPIKAFNFVGPEKRSFGVTAPVDGSDIIPAGRTLTVDTRPGFKVVRDNAGTNYWPKLKAQPELWSLPDGTSECTVSITPGAPSARVRLTFQPRYEGY
ncbi:phage tail family protein [Streptomyces sp. NBC_01241]|uniref:phage tail family protein n=1 Tax=Streptomyces sp. NBC_01241 TaxID=2903794 RepID=UPI00352BFBBF|nr:phage tail family protein [Streptomyces sp. NBC_01241]